MKKVKKGWRDPVKDQPAKPETLAIQGSFEKFTADMKKLFERESLLPLPPALSLLLRRVLEVGPSTPHR